MNWIDKIVTTIILLIGFGLQYGLWATSDAYLWLTLTIIPFLVISVIYLLPLSKQSKRIINLYRFVVLILGPFATLGCLMMVFLSPRRHLVDDYREFLASEIVFTPSEQMELGLKHHNWQAEDIMITPYIDIMEGDDSLLKRNTINKVIQHPGPNSRTILDIGLNDADSDIRFYSASALILLNDSFIKEFREIQDKVKLAPDNAQHHFELALSYDRYCTWKLPEKEDLFSYYVKIEQSYKTALALDPKNLNVMIGLVRVMIKRKNYTGVANILEKGLTLYPGSSILMLQYLKLLYRQKKFQQLNQQAKTYLARFPNVSLEIQEAVAFWVESDKPEKGYEYYLS